MVDSDPGAYRPRRAFLEPDHTEDDGVAPDVDGSNDTFAESAVNGLRARRAGSRALPEPAETSDFAARQEPSEADKPTDAQPREGASPPRAVAVPLPPTEDTGSHRATSRRSIFADLDDDEEAPPLFRDGGQAPRISDETTTGTTPLRDPAADEAGIDTGRQTWVRPALASAARRFRPPDPEATTILPRTSSRSRDTGGWRDSIDDFADIEEGGRRFGKKTRLALLIAGVAAVVVVGLAIGWAVLGIGDTPTPSPAPPSTGNSMVPTSAPSGGQAAELLNDDSMLSAKDAKRVSDRTWKIALTQRGTSADSPKPACLGGDPAEGQPASAQTILRLLSAEGKGSLGILHQADAFNTPEDAGQAFAVAAKTLGGCVEEGGWVKSGWSVTGLGDQAVGLVVVIERDAKTVQHSVVLNRTGRVMNIVDLVASGDPVEVGKVANALAAATAKQCGGAGGACPEKVSVKAAPPPLGGDQPGFLAAGDLPPVGQTTSLWVGDVPDVPRDDFAGAQCENTNWATAPASARTSRTYLVDQGADPGFGLDEIMLTMKNDKAARNFVSDLRTTVEKCPKRKLTATVPSPKSVSGPGANGTKIDGWTVTVTQKVNNGSLKYRLGAVAAGSKVVYTFLSPKGKFDLSDDEWRTVAVRAGQRATQIN